MPVEVIMPKVDMDMSAGTLVSWFAREGERVEQSTPLFDIETDKATMEVESPASGTLRHIVAPPGTEVPIGATVAWIYADDEDSALPADAAAVDAAAAKPAPANDPAPLAKPVEAAAPDAAVSSPVADASADKPRATPRARSAAKTLGVDLRFVGGSGPRGRIQYVDVARAGNSVNSAAAAQPQFLQPTGLAGYATGLTASTHTDCADISALETFRGGVRAEADARGVRLTLLAFLLKAIAATLREYPRLNASLGADQRLALNHDCSIGVALDGRDGLQMATVKNADRKRVLELAAELAELGAQARAGELRVDGHPGAGFSVYNFGAIGGSAVTPPLAPPAVAALGAARANIQPRWNEARAEFAPALLLPLTLSYDPRAVDGVAAARFSSYLCGLLGDVRRLLL